jgi:hypothetical protein
MAKDNPYVYVVVESYIPENTSGLHGPVHIRPVKDEQFPQNIQVECSKKLSKDYSVGTKFRIQAKLTDREGSGDYLYSSYKWPFEVLS